MNGEEAAPVKLDWSIWLAHPLSAGLLCDYDGTLAPVVEDRDKAVPLPGAPEVLAKLAGRLALVGVVSGRPLEYLLANLGTVKGLSLFGLYGLERLEGGRRGQGAPQAPQVSQAALAWEGTIQRAASEAERALPAGVEVERKGLTFVLHSRRHPELAPRALEWARDMAEEKGLKVQSGRLSVELLPPVASGKGAVVEELSTALQALCYIGDDRGDLPAFEALHRLRSAGKATFGVGVASPEQPPELAGAVDLLVDGPPGALRLLEQLARGLT